MVQINIQDLLDMTAVLVINGNDDLTEMFISILPKGFKFSVNDISTYEDSTDMTSHFSGYRNEKTFIELLTILREKGVYN